MYLLVFFSYFVAKWSSPIFFIFLFFFPLETTVTGRNRVMQRNYTDRNLVRIAQKEVHLLVIFAPTCLLFFPPERQSCNFFQQSIYSTVLTLLPVGKWSMGSFWFSLIWWLFKCTEWMVYANVTVALSVCSLFTLCDWLSKSQGIVSAPGVEKPYNQK